MQRRTTLLGWLGLAAAAAALAFGGTAATLLSRSSPVAHACDIFDPNPYACSPPEGPQHLTASPVDETSIVLRWEDRNTVFSWMEPDVLVRVDGGAPDAVAFDNPRFENDVVDHLSFGHTYCFSVALVALYNPDDDLKDGPHSAYSDWVCAQTVQPQLLHGVAPQGSATPPAPPATPLSLRLVDGDAQHKQIGWSFPAGAGTPDWFAVYRDGTLVGTTPSLATLEYTYTDAFQVSDVHTYSYKVCAAFRRGDLTPVENCSTALKVASTLQLVGTPLPAPRSISVVKATPPPTVK
jgi:hypothetical protein